MSEIKEYTAGMQIETNGAHVESTTGALGCFALNSQGKPVLLSNSHVLFPGFVAAPDTGVWQPDYSSCCSGGDRIATTSFDPAKVEDGQYKGGFKTQIGPAQIPTPSGTPTVDTHHLCSETDCAIATLDKPAKKTRYRNVWKTPEGEIQLKGVNEDVMSVKYVKAGQKPPDDAYVRVYSPRLKKLFYGTIFWSKTDSHVDSKEMDDGIRRTPLYRFGISDVEPKDDAKAGSIPAINQFLILPRAKPIPGEPDYKKFYLQPDQALSFDHGDSGSVVIDSQGRVIAQIVRKLPFRKEWVKPEEQSLPEFASVGNLGIASPIRAVLEQLSITIPDPFDKTLPASGVTVAMGARRAAEERSLERLREGLRTSRRGQLLLGKVGQHKREVRLLLARVRAVNAAWVDLGGAAFYNHCLRSARDPRHVIPDSINGVSRERLAEVLLPALAAAASPELRRDIERHGPWLVAALLPIRRLDDAPDAIAAGRGARG